jgi:hypothetical protein
MLVANTSVVLRRVDGGDKAKAELLRHNGACDLQRRDREPRRQPDHRADNDLLH